MLEVLHVDGYGDYYEVSDPRHALYHSYLRDRMKTYIRQLAS